MRDDHVNNCGALIGINGRALTRISDTCAAPRTRPRGSRNLLSTVMSTRRQTRSISQSRSEDTRTVAPRGRGKRGRGNTSSAPPGKRSRSGHSPETGSGRQSLTRQRLYRQCWMPYRQVNLAALIPLQTSQPTRRCSND